MSKNIIKKVIELTGLSIDKLASILGVSRQTISNYEKNPDQISLKQLMNLSSETGISVEKLLEPEKRIMGPTIRTVYGDYSNKIKRIIDSAVSFRNEMNDIQIESEICSCKEAKKQAAREFDNIAKIASIKGRKPKICAFGPSDTGKSTLINYLLRNDDKSDEDVVPTGYSPLTSVPTFLKHKDEKPAFLNNPSDNAIVLGRKKGEKNEPIRHESLSEEEWKEHIIRIGNYKSVLREFGTRDGEYYKNSYWDIDEIVIYADRDLLREITLVDIPGFGSGEKKDDVGLTMDASAFDIIFFLSTVNAYLRGDELAALGNILRMREDLSTFYLLGTHANVIGDPNQLKSRIHSGCELIVSGMSENEKKRLNISENDFEALEKRCFAFDINSKKYCNELNEVLEYEIPKIVNERLNKAVLEVTSATKEYTERYEELLKNIDGRRISKSPEEIKSQKKEREKALQEALKRISDSKCKLEKSVKDKKDYCSDKIKDKYRDIINNHHIEHLIDKKGIKNKKSDINRLTNYLSNELNDSFVEIIRRESNHFTSELNYELQHNQKNIEQNIKKLNFSSYLNDFDVEKAFVAGLAGVSTYGALAFWASVVAGGSNLGAYILVAKVVSALSAIGISVGGTAAAAAWVASIGGPVTIGIALAAIAAIATWGIFTGTWKSRLAKRIVDEYDDKHVCGKFRKESDKYWNDTTVALDECFDSLANEVKTLYFSETQIDGMDIEDYVKMTTILQMIYSKCLTGYRKIYTESCS
ncbi:Helix-turn-helix [Lachnospiraceae bacterium]|nr:Helix-turn-helix [Lachnospiraceae bacterium]